MLAFTKPDPSNHPARSKRLRRAPPQDDFLAGLPDLTPSIYDIVAPCPTCGEKLHPRAVLCLACGTDLTTHLRTSGDTKAIAPHARQLPSRDSLLWTVGVLVGASIAAALLATLATQLGLHTSPAKASIGAAIGATIIILSSLARTLGPH